MINAGKSPFDAATRKGVEAAKAGLPESACPYKDRRQSTGRLSFSRAWRNAWVAGYRSVAKAVL